MTVDFRVYTGVYSVFLFFFPGVGVLFIFPGTFFNPLCSNIFVVYFFFTAKQLF